MKKVMPNPNMLPVRTSILITCKNIKFDNIVMKPYQSINDLKKVLEEQFEKRKDPVTEWGQIKVILQGPLYGGDANAIHQDGDE